MVLIQSFSSWIKQPIIWIILFGLLRLYGITNPPLETGHNWRQVTGLMVARNFFEENANILYPRVDLEGGDERIVGMEFPLLNYVHFTVAKVFGYHHWYGRLINLIISSLGIYCFSRLLRQLFSKEVALYATVALLSSIFFSYSRKMMPDTFSISLGMIAIYYAYNYFQTSKIKDLFLYLIIGSLGILAKIPAAIVFSPLVLFLFSQKYTLEKKLKFLLASILLLLPVFYWYYIWNPTLEKIYGTWYNSGMSFREGVSEIANHLSAVWRHISFHSFYGYGFFLLFLWGLGWLFFRKEKLVLSIFFIYALVAILYIFKAGFFFHHHNYYVIPLVPIMAVIVGYGLQQINSKKLIVALLGIASIESIANQQHDFRIKEQMKYKMEVVEFINQNSQINDKLIVLSEGNPQLLYLSHRKGWIRHKEELQDPTLISELKNEGAQFILVDKNKWNIQLDFKEVDSNSNFVLYTLSERR